MHYVGQSNSVPFLLGLGRLLLLHQEVGASSLLQTNSIHLPITPSMPFNPHPPRQDNFDRTLCTSGFIIINSAQKQTKTFMVSEMHLLKCLLVKYKIKHQYFEMRD